ncbi:MAG: nitrite reductase small subunit NirD [Methylococcaceae bacterium]|nr:nitrite reductase small subunit NirD [Methylococcaceae bacterium]
MNDWLHIGKLEDIPLQGARVLETAFGNIAVFRTQANEVFALRDRCPHRGGPLSQGIVYGRRVACPLHNWAIELESGEAVAPDKGCARRFSVKVERGEVYLAAQGDTAGSSGGEGAGNHGLYVGVGVTGH